MRIAYNPEYTTNGQTNSWLDPTTISGDDLIFDLPARKIYAKGVMFDGKVYERFQKATANMDGEDGLVPFPDYNNNLSNRYLKEDGSWDLPPNTEYEFEGGVNKFTVIPSNSESYNVTITPYIPIVDNIQDGLAPKINVNGVVGNNDGVLTGKTEASWKKLPETAFKDTTYVFSEKQDPYQFGVKEGDSAEKIIDIIAPVMNPASQTSDGTEGLVPQPKAGEQNYVLHGSGKWKQLTQVYDSTITIKQNGFTDSFTLNQDEAKTIQLPNIPDESFKINLGNALITEYKPSSGKIFTFTAGDNVTLTKGTDSLQISAKDTTYTSRNGIDIINNVIQHAQDNGWHHIPKDGTAGQYLQYSSAGQAKWATFGLSRAKGTQNANYRVYFSNTTDSDTATQLIYDENNFTYNPSTNTLTVTKVDGIAAEAKQLTTARTITLSGHVSGSASFDGSANVTINTVSNVASLKNPYTLTITRNTNKAQVSYDGSEAKAFNISTNDLLNDLPEASGSIAGSEYFVIEGNGDTETYYRKPISLLTEKFVTSLGTSGNYVTWTKAGTTNNLTVPYSTKSSYLQTVYCRDDSQSNANAGLWNQIKSGSIRSQVTVYDIYSSSGPSTHGELLEILSYNLHHYQAQLWFGSGKTGKLYYRNKDYNNDSWGDWRTIAFTDDLAGLFTELTNVQKQLSVTIGGINKKLTLDYATSAGSADKLGSTDVGSATKGIYLDDGSPKAMSYSLSATVNAGTASKLAYYSGINAIDDYTSTVGGNTQPIYLNGGVPTAISYTINKSVPSNAVFTDTNWGRSISWNATTTVNAWSKILKINGTGNVILACYFGQNSQSSCNLYLINTGWATAQLSQLGYNQYKSNSSIQVRVTQISASEFHVEVYNTYGYQGATTISISCQATSLGPAVTLTAIEDFTSGSGTSKSQLVSAYSYAANFTADRAKYIEPHSDIVNQNTTSNTFTNVTSGTVAVAKEKLVNWMNSAEAKNTGIGANTVVSQSLISNWNNGSSTLYASSVYSVIKIGGGYQGSAHGQWLLSTYGQQALKVIGRHNNAWTEIKTIAWDDVFIASGNNAAKGLVPKPSTTAGSTKYLCENATWSTPPDTKVTSVSNHYTPSSTSTLSASASGATAAWSIDVVKGITLNRDAAGHITGISVTSGKIPTNPHKVTNIVIGDNNTTTSHETVENPRFKWFDGSSRTGMFQIKGNTGLKVESNSAGILNFTNTGVTSFNSQTGGLTSTYAASVTTSTTGYYTIGTLTIAGTPYTLYGKDTNTNILNTAGALNTSSKIYLVGATSQTNGIQTYSHDTAYVDTDGCLYSNLKKVSVEGHTHSQYYGLSNLGSGSGTWDFNNYTGNALYYTNGDTSGTFSNAPFSSSAGGFSVLSTKHSNYYNQIAFRYNEAAPYVRTSCYNSGNVWKDWEQLALMSDLDKFDDVFVKKTGDAMTDSLKISGTTKYSTGCNGYAVSLYASAGIESYQGNTCFGYGANSNGNVYFWATESSPNTRDNKSYILYYDISANTWYGQNKTLTDMYISWNYITNKPTIPTIPSIRVTESGSGSAITSIAPSGHTLTVTKSHISSINNGSQSVSMNNANASTYGFGLLMKPEAGGYYYMYFNDNNSRSTLPTIRVYARDGATSKTLAYTSDVITTRGWIGTTQTVASSTSGQNLTGIGDLKFNSNQDVYASDTKVLRVSTMGLYLYNNQYTYGNIQVYKNNSSSTASITLSASGKITATGEITAYSDIRLKSNIKPLENRGFITPITYEKNGKESIGFSAQEVQEKYPELVQENEDTYLSLNYSQYTAVLQAQIIELKKEIDNLKSELNGIRKY